MSERINRITAEGICTSAPVISHRAFGEDFHTFRLAVRRLSGTDDELRVILRASMLSAMPPPEGCRLRVGGEIRSYNSKNPEGRRLIISIAASSVLPVADGEGVDTNEAELEGFLCKPPVYRRTPLGREICDMILAVSRAGDPRGGKADYIPVITWGRAARDCSQLAVGAPVHILGRLQSRPYVKETEEGSVLRTAVELSVSELLP